ncbi:MAG: reverse transcriptase/maturase family protein [Planctomycetota bacterium]|jgi:hypothetical protein
MSANANTIGIIIEYMPSELIQKVASDSVIDSAYDWLCKRRKGYSHNDEVWDIRFRWSEFKPHLQKTLLAGEYTISSQIVIKTPDRRTELWSAKDALVLKALSIVLSEYLKPVLSRNCYHLAGHGGAKAAVRATAKYLKQGQHIMKSDVRGYYANIDHEILFNLLQEHVPDRLVQKLLWQYIRRRVYCDGFYRDIKRGISLGCSLSPLIGALYLKQLDDGMEKTGLFYARFMDDWVVIAPTRWKLREAIRIVNETLNVLKADKHPDKTFIGKVEHGFDFLGYFLKPGILKVAVETMKRFTQRITQLYEQGADYVRIGEYVRHWLRWVRAGVVLPLKIFIVWGAGGISQHLCVPSTHNALRAS